MRLFGERKRGFFVVDFSSLSVKVVASCPRWRVGKGMTFGRRRGDMENPSAGVKRPVSVLVNRSAIHIRMQHSILYLFYINAGHIQE